MRPFLLKNKFLFKKFAYVLFLLYLCTLFCADYLLAYARVCKRDTCVPQIKAVKEKAVEGIMLEVKIARTKLITNKN